MNKLLYSAMLLTLTLPSACVKNTKKADAPKPTSPYAGATCDEAQFKRVLDEVVHPKLATLPLVKPSAEKTCRKIATSWTTSPGNLANGCKFEGNALTCWNEDQPRRCNAKQLTYGSLADFVVEGTALGAMRAQTSRWTNLLVLADDGCKVATSGWQDFGGDGRYEYEGDKLKTYAGTSNAGTYHMSESWAVLESDVHSRPVLVRLDETNLKNTPEQTYTDSYCSVVLKRYEGSKVVTEAYSAKSDTTEPWKVVTEEFDEDDIKLKESTLMQSDGQPSTTSKEFTINSTADVCVD